MDGLLGPTPTQAPEQQSAAVNPITQQIRDRILETAPPQMRSDIERMVIAGNRMMFDPSTHSLLMKQFKNMPAENAADRLAQGVAALMTHVRGQSKGPFPMPAIAPAAVMLLMDLIDFFGEQGQLEVTPELVAEATEELTGYLMKKLNIGPEQIQMARDANNGGQMSGPPESQGLLAGGA